MNLHRYILTWTVATAIALAPSWSIARESEAKPVTPDVAIKMGSPDQQRAMDIKRYVSAEKLAEKAAGLLLTSTKFAGVAILHDAFQTALIMFAASAAQLAKARMERDGLLNGYKPKVEDVQKATLTAAEDVICGAANERNPTVSGEILCSGEFWMGVGGAVVGRAAVQAVVVQALKGLLKLSPTRAALINLVGVFAASFLMLGGFTMSAQLWTQGVHLLNDPVKEQQARGIFMRAMANYLNGHWSDYIKTPDGQIAAAIFTNMHNILITDPAQREAWFDNGWRFGVARGEMIVNLTILMSAMGAGGAVGAALAATYGLPEAVFSFVVGSAFGCGISYAQAYFPDLEVGTRLTGLIQSGRTYLAQYNHSQAQFQIEAVAQTYNTHPTWTSSDPRYKKIWEKRMASWLPALRTYRQKEAGIILEKYHELRNKIDEAQSFLNMAKEVIEHSELRNAITFNEGGEYLSVKQAQEKYCQRISPKRVRNCDFPLKTQLKRIEASQAIINDGEALLAEYGKSLLNSYAADPKLLQGLLDNVSLQFPETLAGQMVKEINIANGARGLFRIYFASLHENIRQEFGINIPGGEETREAVAVAAKSFIARAHMNGVDDEEINEEVANLLRKSGGDARETSPFAE